jgi:dTDP-4-amino-4,6-dideoxygalactose transaminase
MSVATALPPIPLLSIPLLDVSRQTAAIREEIDAAIARVLDHSRFIMGPEVEELEDRIAEYCGTRFAVACASGSDALLLPLLALGLEPGDRVITTPFTFFATAGSIVRAGGRPVFVDIEPRTFNMDPAALAIYLENCTAAELRTIRAIIPVHLFGHSADMEAVNILGSRFGIPVIEDAAQAIGAEYRGVRAGALGLCGTFSFFPSKNLGGFGDGGMITTDDAAFADKLRLLRLHGSGTTYIHKYAGINSRLDTLQAAILLVKFRYLEEWTVARRKNAAIYNESLAQIAASRLRTPAELPGMKHVYNQYTVRVAHRDRVRARLAEQGVGSAVYYPLPLHLQECFADLGYGIGDFPESEAAAREVLSLPVEPGLTAALAGAVSERLHTAMDEARSDDL